MRAASSSCASVVPIICVALLVEVRAVRAVDGRRDGVADEVLLARGEHGVAELELLELVPLALERARPAVLAKKSGI